MRNSKRPSLFVRPSTPDQWYETDIPRSTSPNGAAYGIDNEGSDALALVDRHERPLTQSSRRIGFGKP